MSKPKSIEDLKDLTENQISKILTTKEIADLLMSTNVFKEEKELPKLKTDRVDMLYAVVQNRYNEEEEDNKAKKSQKPYPYKTVTYPKSLITPIVQIFDNSEPYDFVREKFESLQPLIDNFNIEYELENFRKDFEQFKDSNGFTTNNEILDQYLKPYFQVLKDLEESIEEDKNNDVQYGYIMRGLENAVIIKLHEEFNDLSDLRNIITEEEYSSNQFDKVKATTKRWLDLLKF